MSLARRLAKRAEQTGTSPWRLATRVATSVVCKRVPGLRWAVVTIDNRGTKIRADLNSPFGLSLYRYGFPEPEARLLLHLLRPGDVFLDGGAHIGVFTLLAAALIGETGRVVSCEPVPENMLLLKANVELNRFSWVDTHMVALSDRSGPGELFAFGSGSALSSYAPASRTGSHRLAVEQKTLDEIAASYGSLVRLIKLDIEGAEVRALRGASTLLQTKPDFLLEVEPEHLGRQGATVQELQALFSEAGYQGFEIHEDQCGILLVPMDSWRRPVGNPNVFVSARLQFFLGEAAVNGGYRMPSGY